MCNIDKSQVAGLPAHAQVQRIRNDYYVFFAYCFSINSRRKQERDYIGKVDAASMVFVPNGYYAANQPKFHGRPLERWRDPEKRERERRKIPPPSPVIEPTGGTDSGNKSGPPPETPIEKEIETASAPNIKEGETKDGKKTTAIAKVIITEDKETAAGNSRINDTQGCAAINAVDASSGSLNPNSGLPGEAPSIPDSPMDTGTVPEQCVQKSANGEPCGSGHGKECNSGNVQAYPTDGLPKAHLDGDCEHAHNGGIAGLLKTTGDMDLENPTANAIPPLKPYSLAGDAECAPVYRYVGATAVCLALLEQTGMTADICNHALDGDIWDTMNAINLAVHAAVTSKATYLAGPESLMLQFIGPGCLKSPRASEFFQRIGSRDDILLKLSKARVARLGKGHLLALDGTCVDCGAKKISLSQVGKKKNGTFGPQINLSVLLDTDIGSVVGMRPYAGNVTDIKTVDDYLNIWESFGVGEKDPILTFDRGFGSAATLVKLDAKGFRYIIGLKTELTKIKAIINSNEKLLRVRRSLLDHHNCYGLKEPITFTWDGESADIEAFVYRNPQSEMVETHAFMEKLHKFEGAWESGKCDKEDPLCKYYVKTDIGKPLRRNEEAIDDKCATCGFFALASNVAGLSKDEVLTRYAMRGDVETVFGLMFKHLVGSTRVHSTPALVGLLLTIFIGLDFLTTLRTRMKGWMPIRPKSKKVPQQVRDVHSIASLLHQLNHIRLQRYGNGKIALLDVSEKDRELVAAIGLPGLFDSAQKVHDLFTQKHLEEVVAKG